MEKHERILETYKRIHKGKNFEDAEKAKISRERNQVNKLEKKAKKILNNVSSESEDGNFVEEFEAIAYEASKVNRNLKTHKNRLKELMKNDDFI